MIEPALREMIEWVEAHRAIPEIADFLHNLAVNRGQTLEELAEADPDQAWVICDALFEMEEDTFTDEMLHEYLRKNQPPRRPETIIVLPDV